MLNSLHIWEVWISSSGCLSSSSVLKRLYFPHWNHFLSKFLLPSLIGNFHHSIFSQIFDNYSTSPRKTIPVKNKITKSKNRRRATERDQEKKRRRSRGVKKMTGERRRNRRRRKIRRSKERRKERNSGRKIDHIRSQEKRVKARMQATHRRKKQRWRKKMISLKPTWQIVHHFIRSCWPFFVRRRTVNFFTCSEFLFNKSLKLWQKIQNLVNRWHIIRPSSVMSSICSLKVERLLEVNH